MRFVRNLSIFGLLFSSIVGADTLHPILPIEPDMDPHQVASHRLEIPITSFSNMASGYQATNPGFRAILTDLEGQFVAGGPLTMESVIDGKNIEASQGSLYVQLMLSVAMTATSPKLESTHLSGTYEGYLDICMASDWGSQIEATQCRDLKGNLHPDRPFQWLKKRVQFEIDGSHIQIKRFYGYTGDGGTSKQIALVAHHAIYGFSAPGKSFKDYQSPLVLDLNHNGSLDLINVHNDATPISFDLNGDGEKVRTGWVEPTDGILFWNGSGSCPTSGADFLGEFTDSKDGEKSFENGFIALMEKTQSKDRHLLVEKFPALQVWVDKKKDGICEPGETFVASKVIKSISLEYKPLKDVPLNQDNEVKLVSTYTDKQGQSHLIGDVWFKQRRQAGALSLSQGRK